MMLFTTLPQLIALIVLFAGLCCFTYWLRTGTIWPGPFNSYWNLMSRSINPTGAEAVTATRVSDAATWRMVYVRPLAGLVPGPAPVLQFAPAGEVPKRSQRR